jgi:hypothetical protein
MTMIILNGSKFAETEEEFTGSLFEQGGSCVGYVKPYRKSIVIQDHNRNKVGVINKHGVLCKATKQGDGQYWYSYGDIDLIGEYASYMLKVNECEDALRKLVTEKTTMPVIVVDEDTQEIEGFNIATTKDPQEAQQLIWEALPSSITYWTAYHNGQWLSTSEL